MAVISRNDGQFMPSHALKYKGTYKVFALWIFRYRSHDKHFTLNSYLTFLVIRHWHHEDDKSNDEGKLFK